MKFSSQASKAGFSLIEVLLAVMVMTIFVTTVMMLAPAVMLNSQNTRDSERARAFAETVFATLENQAAFNTRGAEDFTLAGSVVLQEPLGWRPLGPEGVETVWPQLEAVDIPGLYYTWKVQPTNSVWWVTVNIRTTQAPSAEVYTFEGFVTGNGGVW